MTADPILSPDGVRALDARLERAGLLDLAMEEAGRAVADAVQDAFPVGRVLLLAGGGANGGDALVAARHLAALGRDVQVLAAPARHPLTRANRKRLGAVGVQATALSAAAMARELKAAAVIVDGLLGTGFTPPLRPELAEIVAAVNASGLPVVAIDLPTGLDATRAELPGESIQAALTVTLSGLKTALLFGPAAHRAGRVRLAALRLPPGWAQAEAFATRPTRADVARLLPVRFADAHKGTAGRVWVVGGHPGTAGAAALAGMGALRAGAGLVTVYSSAEVPLVMPELMIRRHEDLAGALAKASAQGLPDAVCIGMGLGPYAPALARLVLGWTGLSGGVPCVLDADALQPELAGLGHDNCVWTPHPGEAARILDCTTADVARDPLAAARTLQERYGGAVILKGGPSVVAHSGGLWVSRGGHPGMGSAGMGDTLAGIVAALLGQGLTAPNAALCGVTLHARGGERAGARHGYGLSASDVSGELGAAWLDVVAGMEGEPPRC
ncbi:NAD(P)H-hydrate dehydratase [Deinococcus sp. Arct2-2]|uniref:NAD(P)H-hydrate dehydratase n=1 Tax=Deinococcus sp. Arct2-2 TaxID=2568653 RepID=UPI0010A3F7D0|nr:NAD(P)H-hydrate dehydratase [Deinococcus sp. Arct2-2]THF69497.1 NAD(P)H-hydrate dehydratase [Deinococcus sp. Arct2-2]